MIDAKCPTCAEPLTVVESQTTLLGFDPHRDELGRLHSHDPNMITSLVGCRNKHPWIARHAVKCWCGHEARPVKLEPCEKPPRGRGFEP